MKYLVLMLFAFGHAFSIQNIKVKKIQTLGLTDTFLFCKKGYTVRSLLECIIKCMQTWKCAYVDFTSAGMADNCQVISPSDALCAAPLALSTLGDQLYHVQDLEPEDMPTTMTHYPHTGYAYQFVEMPLPWDEAQSYCSSLHPNAHLMDIQTLAEQNLMINVSALDPSSAKECKNTPNGIDYLGQRNVTFSGLGCQNWDSQVPHTHLRDDTSQFPLAVNNLLNYCRNPDYEPDPWCYTIDPGVSWESCHIPDCTDGSNLWLGGKRISGGGMFDIVWVNTGDDIYNGATYWNTAEPDQLPAPADCVFVYSKDQFKWSDAPCSINVPFICEI